MVVPRKPRTKRTSVQQQTRQRCGLSPSKDPDSSLNNPTTKKLAEAAEWTEGAKAKKGKEDKEEKRKAELARKAENARLLAEEEASLRAKKAAPKPAAAKKAAAVQPNPAGPGAIAAGGELAAEASASASAESPAKTDGPQDVESFAATGIDSALELLEVVTAKMDKASVGNQAANLEKHPEVRYFAFRIWFDHSSLTETIVSYRDASK